LPIPRADWKRGGAARRDFIKTGLLALAIPFREPPVAALTSIQAFAQDSLAGQGATGTLRDPAAAGRPRRPTQARENDPEIQAIEQRLACNCGCTLDVFTCRTTDFTCTYSPELHREVLALHGQGKTAQEILDAFVAKYGEKALMAPKPVSFNLVGYLLPGALIVTAGAGLLFFIGRRKQAVSAAAAGPGSALPPPAPASPEELERLRRALAETED
jgi:cytochrome c-type biogenesis protein CcmH